MTQELIDELDKLDVSDITHYLRHNRSVIFVEWFLPEHFVQITGESMDTIKEHYPIIRKKIEGNELMLEQVHSQVEYILKSILK